LHLLLERFQRLIDIVVADDYVNDGPYSLTPYAAIRHFAIEDNVSLRFRPWPKRAAYSIAYLYWEGQWRPDSHALPGAADRPY
jgi:hypothetical protein